MVSRDQIRRVVNDLLPEAQSFLCDLLRFPSTSGHEHEAMCCLEERLRSVGADIERVALSNAIRQDPDYSDPVPDIDYEGRFNLRLVRQGAGGGRTLLFNTHVDVVPPSEGMNDPYAGRCEG